MDAVHTLQNITRYAMRGADRPDRGLMLDVTEQKTFQSQLQRNGLHSKILNTTRA